MTHKTLSTSIVSLNQRSGGVDLTRYLRKLSLLTISVFLLRIAVVGQVSQPAVQPETPARENDFVHYGDVIDVDVVGGFEFDWRGTLTPEGFLDGVDGFSEPVYGLCRTEGQIAADVERVFGKILREPKVVVKILDRSSRAVARLDGAVRTPSRFSLRRRVNLKELLVLAGGLTDAASGDVTIFRPKNLSCEAKQVADSHTMEAQSPLPANESLTINIKISELLTGKASANPLIVSGDLVTVTRAFPVYVIGAVNSPQPIYSRDQTSVSRAVASAGGLSKDAEGGKVLIFRRIKSETQTIDADLSKIKLGQSEDEILRPFDIVDVAVKGGGKRKFPPIGAVDVSRISGIGELPLRIVD